MKNRFSLIIISLGTLLFMNACQTPEERAKEMNGGIQDTNAATTDNATTNTGAADTTSTVTASNETVTKDSADAATTNAPKKSTKGKVTAGINESGKDEKMEMDKSGVYTRAEVMPSYPGGQQSLEKFVEDNLQYPQEALDNTVEGRVLISFDVDETGKIYRPMVVSPKLGYGLEEEALKVVKKMPQWNPGKMKGKNVKTKFTLPISYQLM